MVTDANAYHYTPTPLSFHSPRPKPRLTTTVSMSSSKKSLRSARRPTFLCLRWTGVFILNCFLLGIMAAYFASAKAHIDASSIASSSSSSSPSRVGFTSSYTRKLIDQHGKNALALRSRLDWNDENIPEFCQKILKFPQPHVKNCSNADRVPGTPKCDESRPMMFSQYGEDYYLYTRHFAHMSTPGIYLDIATNDPIAISNTYFMDRCLGWRGLCVEANPKYFERIHRERSCALVPTCVSARDGQTVQFALSGPGSGIVSTHRQGKSISEKAQAVVKLKCVSIMNQLHRFGVSTIDYLNLDVEGHELDVLKSFDWNKIQVNVISVEIAHQTKTEIQLFLREMGFRRIDNEVPVNGMPGMPIYKSNEFYVHSSVEFGRPRQ